MSGKVWKLQPRGWTQVTHLSEINNEQLQHTVEADPRQSTRSLATAISCTSPQLWRICNWRDRGSWINGHPTIWLTTTSNAVLRCALYCFRTSFSFIPMQAPVHRCWRPAGDRAERRSAPPKSRVVHLVRHARCDLLRSTFHWIHHLHRHLPLWSAA